MTTTDQDVEAERAAQALARSVREFCPPSLLADPLSWARRFIADMRIEHWKCIPAPPNVITARREGDPPTEEFLAAKAAITRKDDQ